MLIEINPAQSVSSKSITWVRLYDKRRSQYLNAQYAGSLKTHIKHLYFFYVESILVVVYIHIFLSK